MWHVPQIWKDGECWIIGGGNSITEQFNIPPEVVKGVQLQKCPISDYSPYLAEIHGRHVIAVNMAYQLGNWVDFVFFGDRGFWRDNETSLTKHPSIKVTCNESRLLPKWVRTLARNRQKRHGITCNEKYEVCWNYNSGAAAINLAIYLGCSRIVLLGFDMNTVNNKSHFHGAYKPRAPGTLKDNFTKHKKGFEQIARDAEKLGVEIINANPGSGLECFPKMAVSAVLSLSPAKPIIRDTTFVSVILSAYKTAEWIEQCLDSVYGQTYFRDNEFEVLLAVDNCAETLRKVNDIQHKYPGVKVYRSVKQVGTYVLCNTLLQLAKGDFILRFDTDDIMLPNMVTELVREKQPIIRFRYAKFETNPRQNRRTGDYSCGQVYIDKKILRSAGGWLAWWCAADANLITRIEAKYPIHLLNSVLFLKRMHPEQLTKRTDTGMQSELRDSYRKITEHDRTKKLFRIKMETCELKRL